MDAKVYVIAAWLATVAINTFHWRFRRSERWLAPLQSKTMLVMFAVWLVATCILMFLFWQNLLPAEPFIFATVGFLIVTQLESIWVRYRWRKHLHHSAEAPPFLDMFARSPTAAFDRWTAEQFVGKSIAAPQLGWSPYQTEEVRKILAHATPEELRQFHIEAMIQATNMGATLGEMIGIALGASVTFVFLVLGVMLPFWIMLGLEITGVTFVIWKLQPKIKTIRQKFASMLCATKWARSQGFTPDGLRLQKWP